MSKVLSSQHWHGSTVKLQRSSRRPLDPDTQPTGITPVGNVSPHGGGAAAGLGDRHWSAYANSARWCQPPQMPIVGLPSSYGRFGYGMTAAGEGVTPKLGVAQVLVNRLPADPVVTGCLYFNLAELEKGTTQRLHAGRCQVDGPKCATQTAGRQSDPFIAGYCTRVLQIP